MNSLDIELFLENAYVNI